MIIPRVLSRGTSAPAQRAHFAGVLEAAVDLPSVIYNSPYYGFETRAELFFDLRSQYPHLVGFKEFGGAKSLSYAAEHIAGQSREITLMVGVDTQVFHGYVNCGASGAITGIGNVLPRGSAASRRSLPNAPRWAIRRRGGARSNSRARSSALSSFDEGADLVLYFKHLMTLQGDDEYALHFNESDALSASQKRFAETQLRLFKAWYADWRGAEG